MLQLLALGAAIVGVLIVRRLDVLLDEFSRRDR